MLPEALPLEMGHCPFHPPATSQGDTLVLASWGSCDKVLKLGGGEGRQQEYTLPVQEGGVAVAGGPR